MPPAAKHFDPMIGIDVHIIQPPGPVPPVPIPHPHTAMVMDPCDYAPYIGGTVKVGGLQRAQAGTGGVAIPKHIPIGGVFVKPPENESELFMGSSTVAVDGDAFSYLGLPVLTCQCIGMPPVPRAKGSTPKSLVLPTTVCLAIPMPVSVGGGPTVSLMALGMRAGMAALGALAKKAKKAWKGRKGANGVKCNGAHPVNIVSGENFDDFCDAKEPSPQLLGWKRHYTTARSKECGPLGHAFRHNYQHTLTLQHQAWTYESPEGLQVAFEPMAAGDQEKSAQGYRLVRRRGRDFEVRHRQDPTLVFRRTDDAPKLCLSMVHTPDRQLALEYVGDRLRSITELGAPVKVSYRLDYDDAGRIVEVHRHGSHSSQRVAGYAYDKRGDLVASINGERGRHHYVYDDHHRWVVMREPRGYEFRWTYAPDGRCVEASGQDGLWWAKFDYEPDSNRTSVTEREGGVHVFEYDENGTLRTLIDPYTGELVRYVDESDGRVLAEVDSGGRAIHWLYDENGGHTGRVDRFGHWFPPEEELPQLPDPFESRPPASQREREFAVWHPPASGVDLRDDIPAKHQRLAKWALDRPHVRVSPVERHNTLGRVVERSDETGRVERWAHDQAGNTVAYVDRDGREHRRSITSWNLAGEETNPLGHTSRYTYTSTEMLRSVTDPLGNLSEYAYDQKDRLVEVRRHGRVRESYDWDEGDRQVAKRDGEGKVLAEFVYRRGSQLVERRLAEGGCHRFGYDLAGRLLEVSTETDQVLLHRDRTGRPRYDVRPGGRVDHVYVGARLRRTEFLRRFITRYDACSNGETVITDPSGGRHALRTDGDGRLLRTHHSGTRELSSYDDDGNCLGRARWSAREHWAVRYEYTAEGDLVSASDTLHGCTTYTVDDAHRLVAEDGPHGSTSYALDEAGNLLEPGLGAAVLGDGNRLDFAGATRFEYDRRDRVAARGKVSYRYDSLDQLVAVEDEDHAEPWTAQYDAVGRRLRCGRGRTQTEFYWDHDRLAAEVAPDGRLRIYIYPDEASLVPILFTDYRSVDADPGSGKTYAVFTNQIGAPVRVEDATGCAVWSARVEPYGTTHVDPLSTITFDLRWPGHYEDVASGLFYNRHRYYDPGLGRYIQPDPLGQGGGLNVYAYPANPLVDIDLQGLIHAKKGKANSAKAKNAERPKTNSGVKDGDVASYGELNRRAEVGDGIDHDHIPAYASARDAVNNQLAKQGKKPLTKAEKQQLKNNLTTMAMDHDHHRLSRSYKGKGGKARQAEDAADLKKATKDDLDVGKKNLKEGGENPKDVDQWGNDVDQRNEDIGLYDDPINEDLWKTDMREQ